MTDGGAGFYLNSLTLGTNPGNNASVSTQDTVITRERIGYVQYLSVQNFEIPSWGEIAFHNFFGRYKSC